MTQRPLKRVEKMNIYTLTPSRRHTLDTMNDFNAYGAIPLQLPNINILPFVSYFSQEVHDDTYKSSILQPPAFKILQVSLSGGTFKVFSSF